MKHFHLYGARLRQLQSRWNIYSETYRGCRSLLVWTVAADDRGNKMHQGGNEPHARHYWTAKWRKSSLHLPGGQELPWEHSRGSGAVAAGVQHPVFKKSKTKKKKKAKRKPMVTPVCPCLLTHLVVVAVLASCHIFSQHSTISTVCLDFSTRSAPIHLISGFASLFLQHQSLFFNSSYLSSPTSLKMFSSLWQPGRPLVCAPL